MGMSGGATPTMNLIFCLGQLDRADHLKKAINNVPCYKWISYFCQFLSPFENTGVGMLPTRPKGDAKIPRWRSRWSRESFEII